MCSDRFRFPFQTVTVVKAICNKIPIKVTAITTINNPHIYISFAVSWTASPTVLSPHIHKFRNTAYLLTFISNDTHSQKTSTEALLPEQLSFLGYHITSGNTCDVMSTNKLMSVEFISCWFRPETATESWYATYTHQLAWEIGKNHLKRVYKHFCVGGFVFFFFYLFHTSCFHLPFLTNIF